MPSGSSLEATSKETWLVRYRWLLGNFFELAQTVGMAVLIAFFWGYTGPDWGREARFQQAIRDVAARDGREPRPELFALNDENQDLVRRDGEILVALVTSRSTVDQHYSGSDLEGTTPSLDQAKLWISLVPELRRFCSGLDVYDPTTRIIEYLGLPPDGDFTRIVELWVKPEDVFRPCPDPSPVDELCEFDWHGQPEPPVKGVPDYMSFYLGLFDSQYRLDGAPWTRLGFTFDYGINGYGVGVSEYLLSPGAEYRVRSVSTAPHYCTGGRL